MTSHPACFVLIAVLCLQASDGPRSTILIGKPLPGGERDKVKVEPGRLDSPFGVDFDSAGNMYVVELGGGRVHKLTPEGKFTTLSGNGSKGYEGDGGPADKATFNGMHNVAVTPNGDVYIADSWNHCIRRIDAETNVITTIAGTGKAGFSGDGGPASKATFNFIMCISLNATNDKIYVADLKNRRIRVVDLASGIVRSVAGNGKKGTPVDGDKALKSPLLDPRAVAVDSKDNVYVLERNGHALRVITTDGRIHTVAGTGKASGKDGPALQAGLKSPKHLAVDDDDNVIIADDGNKAIRRYDPRKKTLTTIFGRGMGTPPIHLSRPHGVCINKGVLYVIDTGHHRILKVE